MSKKLKPCPFCCGLALSDFIPEHDSYLIECNDCSSRGQRCETPDLAVAAWNRRAVLDAATAASVQRIGWPTPMLKDDSYISKVFANPHASEAATSISQQMSEGFYALAKATQKTKE